jgi:hypothetical protein
MATKKQQRRRYMRAREHTRQQHAAGADEPKPERSPGKARQQRPGARTPKPPSWTRSARRAALFAAGIFVFVQVAPLGSKLTVVQAAAQAAIFFIWLVPFGYMMDGFLYRRWMKNQQS